MSFLLYRSAKTADVFRKSPNIYPFTLLTVTKSAVSWALGLGKGQGCGVLGAPPHQSADDELCGLERGPVSGGVCLLLKTRGACCSLEDPPRFSHMPSENGHPRQEGGVPPIRNLTGSRDTFSGSLPTEDSQRRFNFKQPDHYP